MWVCIQTYGNAYIYVSFVPFFFFFLSLWDKNDLKKSLYV